MGLAEYQRKRRFNRTPEPAGKVTHTPGQSFVVQKHDASRLHYDFRLELDGVLKSWAVPKGPSLDPSIKRLAIHVEDHPVEYGSFEGIIPHGEYGGGTVLLWDRGQWEPVGDACEGYRTGRFKFRLYGEKFRGRWMLVRTGGRAQAEPENRQWLLFKERDEEARTEGDILEEMPLSVSTGRDLAEIAADRDWVWNSKPKANSKVRVPRSRPIKRLVQSPKVAMRSLPGAKVGALPARMEVQLPTLSTEVPAGDDWFHEIEFDGNRMMCRIDKGKVQLINRNHEDWTKHRPQDSGGDRRKTTVTMGWPAVTVNENMSTSVGTSIVPLCHVRSWVIALQGGPTPAQEILPQPATQLHHHPLGPLRKARAQLPGGNPVRDGSPGSARRLGILHGLSSRTHSSRRCLELGEATGELAPRRDETGPDPARRVVFPGRVAVGRRLGERRTPRHGQRHE